MIHQDSNIKQKRGSLLKKSDIRKLSGDEI
jgi:hypothetical protein